MGILTVALTGFNVAFKHLIASDFILDLHVKLHLGSFSAGESQGAMSMPLALRGGNTPLHPFICCVLHGTPFSNPMAASNLTTGQAWQGLPWHDRQYQEEEFGGKFSKMQKNSSFLPTKGSKGLMVGRAI